METEPTKSAVDRGPSSAWMHDPTEVLNKIPLRPGDLFLDLGCGSGDYALAASALVGAQGSVHAYDKWDYLIDRLQKAADGRALKNVTAQVLDITAGLPLEDHTADVAFIATLLYIFNGEQVDRHFPDLHRVLKPGGLLAVVEGKKEDQPFGPVKEARISPRELETGLVRFGFRRKEYCDLGYNYMIIFEKI